MPTIMFLYRRQQAEDNRAQTIYRAGKSSIWDTRLHELEDMGIGVSLYFQFLKVTLHANEVRAQSQCHFFDICLLK